MVCVQMFIHRLIRVRRVGIQCLMTKDIIVIFVRILKHRPSIIQTLRDVMSRRILRAVMKQELMYSVVLIVIIR